MGRAGRLLHDFCCTGPGELELKDWVHRRFAMIEFMFYLRLDMSLASGMLYQRHMIVGTCARVIRGAEWLSEDYVIC